MQMHAIWEKEYRIKHVLSAQRNADDGCLIAPMSTVQTLTRTHTYIHTHTHFTVSEN